MFCQLSFNANNVKPAEILRQLVEIYGDNVMTNGMVRKLVRQSNNGQTKVYDTTQSGRPSIVMTIRLIR